MRTRIFVRGSLLSGLLIAAAGVAWALPAARQGSLTDHGGTVLSGSPTVHVEGFPAARVTDPVSCPLTCGLTGPPHVGGPIITGSATVLINGLGAARVTSIATESCAVSTVTIGAVTVDIGG